jgi:Flp pilus assembly protein TadD
VDAGTVGGTPGPPFQIRPCGRDSAPPDAGESHDKRDESPDERELLQAFARAVRIAPSEPDYHFLLGQALVAAGRLGEAIVSLTEAARLHPMEASYHWELGQALLAASRSQEAAVAFAEGLRLQPHDGTAANALGAALLAAGDVDQALDVLETAERLGAQPADVRSNRGVALWRRGDRHGALASFEAALRSDPDAAHAHHNLGLALLSLGRPEQALAPLCEARRRAPQNAGLLADVAETLYRLRRNGEAQAVFQEALEISPTCLEHRPRSREAFRALTLAAIREDLPRKRPRPIAWALFFFDGLVAVLAGLCRARRPAVSAALLLLLVVGCRLLWGVAPVYWRHWLFEDDLREVAMTPLDDDGVVQERLDHVVERRGLGPYISAGNCTISTQGQWRTITCRYSRKVELLPGLPRTLQLSASVERPFIDRVKYDIR